MLLTFEKNPLTLKWQILKETKEKLCAYEENNFGRTILEQQLNKRARCHEP